MCECTHGDLQERMQKHRRWCNEKLNDPSATTVHLHSENAFWEDNGQKKKKQYLTAERTIPSQT